MDSQVVTHLTKILSVVEWAFVGLIITYGGYRIWDWIDPMDIHREIEKGNIAAGIKFLGICAVTGAITVAAIVS